MCESCMEDFFHCDMCGTLIPEDEATLTSTQVVVCDDCRDNHFGHCEDCGDWFPDRDIISDDNHVLCNRCFDRNYGTCSNCSDIIHTDDIYYHEPSDNYFCHSCYDDLDHEEGRSHDYHIHDYGYTPRLNFFKLPEEDTNLFFGTEIEMSGGDTSDYDFDMTHKHFWECYDGSVPDGHELISHPMTYNYIVANKPYDKVCKMARRAGYKSHDTSKCGLHVHISRIAFDESYDNGKRLAAFVYLFEKFWKEVVIFSRRKHDFSRFSSDSNPIDQWASRYDQFDPEPNSHNYKSFFDVARRVRNTSGRRHVVNLENNPTIEVRIFKGTLLPSTVIACIQLVNYFFELSHMGIPNLEKLNWSDIREWAVERYPEFSALCDKRGI